MFQIQFSSLIKKGLVVAALLLGSAVVSNSVRSASAQQYNVQCLGNICVGSQIEVTYGSYAGDRGTVVGIDSYNSILSVISQRNGNYIYPRFDEVNAGYNNPQSCLSNICLNDQVRIVSGAYRGNFGRVVGVDSYNYSVTILINQGSYLTASVRDVMVLNQNQPPYPNPFPQPAPNCPPGMIFDAFRGVCIRIAPRPIPLPPHYPYPGNGYPYPGNGPFPPRPVPMPPRPVPMPPRPVPMPPRPVPMPPRPVPMPPRPVPMPPRPVPMPPRPVPMPPRPMPPRPFPGPGSGHGPRPGGPRHVPTALIEVNASSTTSFFT
jgi:ribosomal protein L24